MDDGGGVPNTEHDCDEDLDGWALEELEELDDERCFEHIPCFQLKRSRKKHEGQFGQMHVC